MRTSDKGIELIKGFENLHLKAYMCPAGIYTIGWGHTLGVTPTQQISLEAAESLLREDLRLTEACVSKIAGLTQNQFDALVSFVFNVGVQAFSNSRLRRLVVANRNNEAIRYEFSRWKYATVDGEKVVMPGLERRRKEEANMYFKTI